MTETEDFTVGRNNPLENLEHVEFNNLLGSVAAAFGKEWLAPSSSTNRIQTLWSRQDGVATNQLAILGDAIKRLAPQNANWVARRIRAIKSESAENRKGDLFELLGLSLFALDGQRVAGADDGTPGYDGTIDFGRGALASISLKDFGVSFHQKMFETQVARIERTTVAALRDLRINGFGLRIDASRYPQKDDWEWLDCAVTRIVSDYRSNWGPGKGRVWTLTPSSLSVGNVPLADGHLSYSLTILAPHHDNEQRNINSKIEDACVNLSRHAETLGLGTARFLLIRIPDAASSAECVTCTEEWLQDRPNARVDAVILYQPGVAAPSISAPAGIVHFIAIVTGPGFERWRRTVHRPDLRIQARILVGRCISQPTKLLGTDGSAIGDRYIYQRGHIYTVGQANSDGAIVGNMANPAPGIMIHSVMRIPGQQREFVVRGTFSPDSKLLLYS